MLGIIVVGALLAFGLWAHKVGIPTVVKKLEEVAQRGEAAAEKMVAAVHTQTAQLSAPKPAVAPGAAIQKP